MRSNPTKVPNTTNRANLKEKFDAGQDVKDYFDFSRAVVWGGKRKGAGFKPLGKIRKQVLLSAEIVAKIDTIAKNRKQSFSAVLEDACGSFT